MNLLYSSERIEIIISMETSKGKNQYHVCVKATTWYKDSHSLFDFESTKILQASFNFPLSTKFVTFYRKR